MDGITLSKIAHELRTPLTLINSTLQLIEAQIPQMKELTYWIQLNEDFRDMNDLVDNLTSLPDTVETNEEQGETNLYHLLQSLKDSFLRNPIRQEVSLSLCSTIDACDIASHFPCDRVPVKQVFTNLMKNALEATLHQEQRTVQVSLSTRHVPLSNGKATLHFLRIAIHDNGSGIPQEILPHLYTPFVSDKKNGTGIGLSIVENLVHQQGGYLEVESGSSGTTFSVFLPYK